MGAGKGGEFIRYSKYMFPFVDCVIRLYSELGKPVPISYVEDCMRDIHALRSTGGQYEGRDAALDNGYVKTEPVGGRTRYVPKAEGVVNTAIYLALKEKLNDTIDSLSPDLLAHLLKCMRISLVTIMISKVIQSIPDYIRAIKDPKYAIRLINVQKFIEEFILNIGGVRDEELNQDKALELVRNSALVNFVALKMLSGIEIRHLKPKHYSDVKEFIKTSILTNLTPISPNSRFAFTQLLLIACRNTATMISAIMR
ncbi:MAG: hypothetical protein AT714_00970 [Vulcanisaeta sp. OSP_8]|jgi:hypothetical protein|nr:MAG: hypothetical protein AT714_00970 [Vulcanisaeta sp. OSP_8]